MSKLKLIISMVIFGTIGIFVKYIPLSTTILALARGVIGTVFLLLVVAFSKKKISLSAIKRNMILLICSGIAIGVNWIFLFESYRHTTVATATLCYYLAPVFVILLSPIILKEKLTARKILCVIAALAGMVFVSGILQNSSNSEIGLKGILFGICAAVFYAGVVLMNKFLKDISANDSTIMQLGIAAIVLLPYTLMTENPGAVTLTVPVILLLVTVGILHTGIAYSLYFASMSDLNGQTIAIFSYIDPAVAILLSMFLLKESMDVLSMIGAVLILGATLFSELLCRPVNNFKQVEKNSIIGSSRDILIRKGVDCEKKIKKY